MKLCCIGSRGHWGYVFESLREVPCVELAGISSGCEDPIDKMRRRCADAGFTPREFNDWRNMLDELRPDMVCIDGPFEKHAEMCIEAFRRNIHIFCEKPIALTLSDLERLEQAAASSKSRIVSMVGLRYDPAFYTARKRVRKGAVGKIKLIQCQKSYKLGKRPAFFHARATYGGTLPWVGSHAIDWILFFYGDADFHSVFGAQSREDNFGNGDMEITAQCLFRMKSGVIASVSTDYLRPAAAPTHGDDRIRIAGTGGVLEVSGGKITLIDANGTSEIVPEMPDRKLFSDFVLDIEGVRPGLVDNAATFALTRACLLAQESADTGKVVFF
ncbi:MAG: Glucose--fructose oxidoreductase precursor [Lentisphaerae bacterium ADurb.Bin242]|nr:MAG: Glucose--fructose oxidoreductase precursor [Lentisphaerae bacterium ADurb.Bin242]